MIRAVERALAIFDAFDVQHQSLSLLEIGERISMPKATTFRLVNTLQRNGFLVRLEDQRYFLSLKILRLSGLLAYAGDEEIARIVAQSAAADKVDPTELMADLAKIRSQGFACTSGQRIPGVTAISVPIFDIKDEVHYSLSLTGPSIRMDPRLKEFKAIMLEAGASISAMMGTSQSPIAELELVAGSETKARKKPVNCAVAASGTPKGSRRRAPAA